MYQDILVKLVGTCKEVVKDNLVGVYLHGSLAMGCFNPEKSDIDLLIIIHEKLSDIQKKQLMDVIISLHREAAGKGIELSVVRKQYCEQFEYPTPFELHFSSMHLSWYMEKPEDYIAKMQGTDYDLAAHFMITKHRGITLYGEEISSVFGEIPKKDYLDSIKRDIEEAEQEVLENLVYIILNLCRVLAYTQEGLILSKKEGGEWGIKYIDSEYRGIIKAALDCYASKEEMLLDKNDAIGFYKEMKSKIEGNKNRMKQNYTEINSVTWDKWSENQIDWSIPVSHEEYLDACAGKWGVYLTPCITVPKEWFGELSGKKVLGLASGGAQQMPIFTALGAECTIFDNSAKQLEAEQLVAEREGYHISVIKGDMTKDLPFSDESFDLIFHPVSNCYVEDVYHVWKECYRVLKKGGILLAGFDNGINYLFGDDNPLLVVNPLPFNPLKMGRERFEAMKNNYEGIQFSHSMEEQIGGQLKAGFILKELYEDRDRENGAEIRNYAPQYMATRAVKPE